MSSVRKKYPLLLALSVLIGLCLSVLDKHYGFLGHAHAEPELDSTEIQINKPNVRAVPSAPLKDPEEVQSSQGNYNGGSVQAILTSSQNAVISGTIDGVLTKLPYENGDKFEEGDTLAQYDCRLEYARIEEIAARIELSSRQLEAYNRLKQLDAISEVEYLSVVATNKQEKALYKQAQARASLCKIKAPFDGRVIEKSASNHEAVRSGRVLMEISALEPLKAELLVPSEWLRWLNIGTELGIYISESGKDYRAEIVRIHGQVDPVTRTAHVVAKIDGYQEELLPGMSGKAVFNKPADDREGFLGLTLGAE